MLWIWMAVALPDMSGTVVRRAAELHQRLDHAEGPHGGIPRCTTED